MEWYYVLLIGWLLVVVTHALTKVYGIPEQKVIEVREIEINTVQAQTFVDDYFVADMERTLMPPGYLKEKNVRRSIERLFHSIPLEMFELFEWEDWANRQTNCRTKLVVIPPLFKPNTSVPNVTYDNQKQDD